MQAIVANTGQSYLQAEGTENAKALRQEWVWCVREEQQEASVSGGLGRRPGGRTAAGQVMIPSKEFGFSCRWLARTYITELLLSKDPLADVWGNRDGGRWL
jgi:hypothetical protein